MPPSIRGNMRNIDVLMQERYNAMHDLISQQTKHELQMLHIQQRSDREREAVSTRSNLQKAHHDVMILIANNMK